MPFRDLELRSQSVSGSDFLNAGILNVKDYGAIGDGTTNDSTALLSAISASNGLTLIIPPGVYRISNNVTVPTNVNIWFTNGAMISVDSGKILTISGKLIASNNQIFTGSGTVVMRRGSCKEINAKWFGAVGDGIADDTSALQSAINCASDTSNVMTVYSPNGTYKITSPLAITNFGVVFRGDGINETWILASGGINGINVTETVSGARREDVILKDFRVYPDTNDTGIGINIYGMRRTLVQNVHVGGRYSVDTNGFNKGIRVGNNPAYYVTIRDCHIQRNRYGVYLEAGANACHLENNVIWYGDYSVYIDGPSNIVIDGNNRLEMFNNYGIYAKDTDCLVVYGNYIEANTKRSIYLTGNTKFAEIGANTYASWVYYGSDVVDESNYPETNKIGLEYVPFRANIHQSPQTGGGIGITKTRGYPYFGYGDTNVWDYEIDMLYMNALKGDLELRNSLGSRRVNIPSGLSSLSFDTPFGGFGNQAGNLILNSEDFTAWTADGITVTANQMLSPAGDLTADKLSETGGNRRVYVNTGMGAIQGQTCNFSVWLRSNIEQDVNLAVGGNVSGAGSFIRLYRIGNEWKRYNIVSTQFHKDNTQPSLSIYLQDYNSPVYAWGAQLNKWTAITGTDNSGVDSKSSVVIDTTKDFILAGANVKGVITFVRDILTTSPLASLADITAINSIITFTTGAGTQPAVGVTVTGGTSGATGTVVSVGVTGGTFAGGDAAGFIEISNVRTGFTGESVTWTGGSATCTAFGLNSAVRFGATTTLSGGYSPTTVNNGDTYFIAPYYMRRLQPYVRTIGSGLSPVNKPSVVSPNLFGNTNLIIPTEDHSVSGTILRLTAGVAMGIGDACYIDSAGKAQLGNADVIATGRAIVICADNTVSQNATCNFLLMGIIRDDSWNWTPGVPIYLSAVGTTGNTLTTTAPSGTDDVILPIGITLTSKSILVVPNLTTIEHQ